MKWGGTSKQRAVMGEPRVNGESLSDLVCRLARCNVDLQWCYYGWPLSMRSYVVMICLNRYGVIHEYGERYRVESRAEGLRLVALGASARAARIEAERSEWR